MGRFGTRGVLCIFVGICCVVLGASRGEAALTATLDNGAILQDGMELGRHTTITFQPDDFGVQLSVSVDGKFYSALGGNKGSFSLPLDLPEAKAGEHRLYVEAYGSAGQVKETLDIKFQITGETTPQLVEQGVDLESSLPTGEPYELEVAGVSKVVAPDEGDYPPILKYLNRGVVARITEAFHQTGEKGLPTLEREVKGGQVWTFIPEADRYGVGGEFGEGQKAQFAVSLTGGTLTGPEEAGVANLGILRLGLPNKKVMPGDGWASGMDTILDLTGLEARVATGEHVFQGIDWVGDRQCAVINSKYSLDGPLTIVFGEQPFVLSRVTAVGTRSSYYDFKSGRFLMAREKTTCWIFLTHEEKKELEALLKPRERKQKIAAGAPSPGSTVGPPLGVPGAVGGVTTPSGVGATAPGAVPGLPAMLSGMAGATPGGLSSNYQMMQRQQQMMAQRAGRMGRDEEESGGGAGTPSQAAEATTGMPTTPMATSPGGIPGASSQPSTGVPSTAAATMILPPQLQMLLGPDGRVKLEVAALLNTWPKTLLWSSANQFPNLFSNDLRKQVGLPLLKEEEKPEEKEIFLVEPAALVVTYELDFLTVSK